MPGSLNNIHLGGTASVINVTMEEKHIAIKQQSYGFEIGRC
jgi:glutathione synthase/RimK-type ligase-like ATP-grasp enzyme